MPSTSTSTRALLSATTPCGWVAPRATAQAHPHRHALAGDYINFGVFELYGMTRRPRHDPVPQPAGDTALDIAFDVFFKMVGSTPMADLLVCDVLCCAVLCCAVLCCAVLC